MVTPRSENAHLSVGGFEGQGDTNFAICEQPTDQGKRLATQRTHLQLKGLALSRPHGDDGAVRFYVTRWGLVQELRDIAAVLDFAE